MGIQTRAGFVCMVLVLVDVEGGNVIPPLCFDI